MNHSEAVSFIRGTATLLRDSFEHGKYPDVILPFGVLRCTDGVPAPTKGRILEASSKYAGRLDHLDPLLRQASACWKKVADDGAFARVREDWLYDRFRMGAE